MKIAVVVAGAQVPAWHAWCVESLRAKPGLDVAVIVTGDVPWERPAGVAARLAGPALRPAIVEVDGTALAGADVIVDLTGQHALAEAPDGVWTFRLGDRATAGDGLPFADEVAAAKRTVEIALERRIGGRCETLRSGRFGVTAWYPSTVRQALAEAARWPATLAAALATGTALDVSVAPARVAAPPRGAFAGIRFAAALASRLVSTMLDDVFEVVEWNVGFVPGGPRRLLTGEPLPVRWLPKPAAMSFIADPFVVERDGIRALFVETFDYHADRGAIEAIVLDDAGTIVRRERVIDLPTHLSYPFPVEIDGSLYVVPENCAGNEVALYRCVQFPDRWKRERALFPLFDGVDTTLFEHDGRWWAFCTRWSHGSTLALHAFYAVSPLGTWEAHPLNPIVVDVASARPAGAPFSVDGVLYRPGQDCSRSYGGGLAIARIDELSPTAYRETVVRRLDARTFGRWNAGIHTVGFTRDQIVVDGKHVHYDVRKFAWAARKIRNRCARLLAHMTRHPAVPAQKTGTNGRWI